MFQPRLGCFDRGLGGARAAAREATVRWRWGKGRGTPTHARDGLGLGLASCVGLVSAETPRPKNKIAFQFSPGRIRPLIPLKSHPALSAVVLGIFRLQITSCCFLQFRLQNLSTISPMEPSILSADLSM